MTFGRFLAILFTAGWVPVFFCRTEQLSDAMPELTRAERLATIVSVVTMSLHMALGCSLAAYDMVPTWRGSIALIVYGAGIGLWFWGRSQISPFAMRRRPDEPPLELRQDGAFGLVRHPLYCGMLIAAFSLVVATASAWVLATYLACAAAIVTRTLQEERRLFAQLGPVYRAYADKVSRLVPGLW